MKINYWDCKYNDYARFEDESGFEDHYYGCEIKGMCNKDNKWNGKKDKCKKAEKL